VNENAAEGLVTLILATQDDPDFRRRLEALLRLPKVHREPLLRTAVDEMTLRGEPLESREAFLLLVDDELARRALAALEPAYPE
jgi:hypothetical protein